MPISVCPQTAHEAQVAGMTPPVGKVPSVLAPDTTGQHTQQGECDQPWLEALTERGHVVLLTLEYNAWPS